MPGKREARINTLFEQKRKIDQRLDDLLCTQCGECCHLVDWSAIPPKVLDAYCEQLEWKDGKAYCKLYPYHHGYRISDGGTCSPVQFVYHRPKNCPYNEIYPLAKINDDEWVRGLDTNWQGKDVFDFIDDAIRIFGWRLGSKTIHVHQQPRDKTLKKKISVQLWIYHEEKKEQLT